MFSRGLTRSALVLGAWLVFTLLTVWLATRGPRLWADARFGHPADDALAIVGIGQFLFVAIAWPLLGGSLVIPLAIAGGAVGAVVLTASLANAQTLASIELGAKLVLLVAVLATIWANATCWRADRRLLWVAVLSLSLGWPSFGWLSRDYASRIGVGSHDSPLRLFVTTFLHD